jgi:DNA-binding GntR family transcriptional regulator
MVLKVAQLADGIKVEQDQQQPAALAPQRQPWRLVDRLGEQTIQEMLHDSHSGATQRRLAERYGISLTSVKRALRRHRC